MRVIAGTLGGRQFSAPHGHKTHPMSEKVRGGLFNALGDISGLSIFDPFTGSGALSFEAISRGASFATAIDNDRHAAEITIQNAGELSIDNKIKVIRANAGSWSDNNPEERFGIVVCDPPYDEVKVALLSKLAEHTMIGGVTVFSLPPGALVDLDSAKYKLLHSKNYGDAELVFYRKIA